MTQLEASSSSCTDIGGPDMVCFHGEKSPLRVSRTRANPGRKFYGCARYKKGEKCSFFTWYDNPPRANELRQQSSGAQYEEMKNSSQVQGHDSIGSKIEQMEDKIQSKIEELEVMVQTSLEDIGKKIDNDKKMWRALCFVLVTLLCINYMYK